MNRRDFVRLGALAVPALSLAGRAFAATTGWRTYQVTTTVRILQPSGVTRVWLPQPFAQQHTDQVTTFQRLLNTSIDCSSGKTSFHARPTTGMQILTAEFAAGSPAQITTVQTVTTRDRSVDLSAPAKSQPLPKEARAFLQPTRYVPTDGIVKAKSDEITSGAHTDLEKTQAIYNWIVNNTQRDARVRGCGVGDIRPMLQTGDLTGKCADINALFVGLVKAACVPARDAYGLRLGPTEFECKSLGTSSDHVQKAQHCRAEVFLNGHGWVPMDPADVRKVMLEETPGGLTLGDFKVQRVQQRLFGSWEMNWMLYNYAQDVSLPGSSGPPLHFFMYPQAETAEGRLDPLDADRFHYEITSHELPA